MSAKRILVTGSSGTIGTRLCERLLADGHEVTGVDLKRNKWNPKVDSMTSIADLTRSDALGKIGSGFDVMVHLAANARVYDLVVEPRMALDNVVMLFNALEFCRKSGAKGIIFASSREVYGNSGKLVHMEGDAKVDNCESPYSASKIAGEALVRSYANCYGTSFVITRFSNVYGMYDESDRVIPLFIRQTGEGKALSVFGKDKFLDFTHIDDTVEGIMGCINKFSAVVGEAFNIASGKGTSILGVAEMIQKEMGRKGKISFGESRPGEVVKFVADITKAQKLLGYAPKTGIEEGIKKTVEWYSRNK